MSELYNKVQNKLIGEEARELLERITDEQRYFGKVSDDLLENVVEYLDYIEKVYA